MEQLYLFELEEWRDIEDYDGKYQVSNWGRVKSLDYNNTGKESLMTLLNDGDGYKLVHLHKRKQSRTEKVHRLVAQAFIPNPDNLPEVNHKDENKSNNNVENLEWCDRKYNNNYGTAIMRSSKTRMGVPHTQEHKDKIRESMKNQLWWTNGVISVRSKTAPEGFVRGRLNWRTK